VYLAHRVPGQCVDDFELLRTFLSGEAQVAAMLTDVSQIQVMVRPKDHKGDEPLPGARARYADQGCIRNSGMVVEALFSFGSRNVLCVANNDVFDAARDLDVPGAIDRAKIPRPEPPFDVERSRIEGCVHIAREALGTSNLSVKGSMVAEGFPGLALCPW
jgi:hypothetical protein